MVRFILILNLVDPIKNKLTTQEKCTVHFENIQLFVGASGIYLNSHFLDAKCLNKKRSFIYCNSSHLVRTKNQIHDSYIQTAVETIIYALFPHRHCTSRHNYYHAKPLEP